MNNSTTIHSLLAIALPLLAFAGLVSLAFVAPGAPQTQSAAAAPVITQEPLPDPFADIAIEGEAAIVYDTKTGETLYQKNAQQQVPLASLTKLMTTYLAVRDLGAETLIEITADDLAKDGDAGLLLNELWAVRDLASFSLMNSSNDAAHALTRTLGDTLGTDPGQYFTHEARKIGLAQTYFLNGTGLDTSATISGGYGSARDIALLLEQLYTDIPQILTIARAPQGTFVSASGFNHAASSTNILADTLPNLLAAKTGFTELAGGNLAVLIDADVDHPVAIVVLGSSVEGRFSDVEMLTQATKEYFSYR